MLLPYGLYSLLEPECGRRWFLEMVLGDGSGVPPAAQGAPGSFEHSMEGQQSPKMRLRPRGCSTRQYPTLFSQLPCSCSALEPTLSWCKLTPGRSPV